MGHWIQFFFGFRPGDGNGPHYLFWSGAGSDISELAINGAVLAGLHRVNCHVKGCPRLARYPIAGGQFKVCAKHHPDHHVRARRLTVALLHQAHRDHYKGAGERRRPDA